MSSLDVAHPPSAGRVEPSRPAGLPRLACNPALNTGPAMAVLVAAALGLALITAPSAGLAAPPQSPRSDDPLGGFLIAPDRIFEEMARGLSRHYGLDDDQRDIVRQMVQDYGRQFVSRNADELRAMQMEGLKLVMLGGKPDSETLRDLSRRVKTLLSDARGPLEEFGNEFHEILDSDQKARHDIERRQVKMVLELAELELDKMILTGALPGPDQQGRGGAANREGDAAAQSRRRFSGAGFLENQWEAYVKSFQAHYRLDADQVRRSEEMLALARKDAADYRKANETKMKDIAASYARVREGLLDRKTPADAKAQLQTEREKLDGEARTFEAPLHEMFEQLKEALDLLPTEEQKTRYRAFPLRQLGKAGKPAGRPGRGEP